MTNIEKTQIIIQCTLSMMQNQLYLREFEEKIVNELKTVEENEDEVQTKLSVKSFISTKRCWFTVRNKVIQSCNEF